MLNLSTMRNRFAPHIDFTFLKGFIRTNPNLMPSNIDMVIERNGKFLFGEWKKEGEKISLGQEIMLKKLAKFHTILIITGDTDRKANVSHIQEITENGIMTIGKTVDDLTNILTDWYNEANK